MGDVQIVGLFPVRRGIVAYVEFANVFFEERGKRDMTCSVAVAPQFEWCFGTILECAESSDAAAHIPYLLAGEGLPEQHEAAAGLGEVLLVLR